MLKNGHTVKQIKSRMLVSDSYIYLAKKQLRGAASPVGLVPDMTPKPDLVNSPPHYTDGGIETIDYIRAKLSEEEFRGYCRGNALKYLSRAGKKGAAAEDHRKAVWYLSYLEDHAA
jgi:hypothetical protein